MSTIQQLKNFIRHGKQARSTNMTDDATRKNDASPPDAPQPVVHGAMPPTEPAGIEHGPHHGVVRDAYSDAPGNPQNKAAQAGHAAAHHAEPGQKVKHESSKSRRVDEANLAKLVAEENASKSKFPKYPGLERWDLREKMGDGAFSNVYRARDLQGEYGEVAIKVVRKYEMNNMQVSASRLVCSSATPGAFLISSCQRHACLLGTAVLCASSFVVLLCSALPTVNLELGQ
jgi:hypothetical protein